MIHAEACHCESELERWEGWQRMWRENEIVRDRIIAWDKEILRFETVCLANQSHPSSSSLLAFDLPPLLLLHSFPPLLLHFSIPLYFLSFFPFIPFVFFSHTPFSLLLLIITIITTLRAQSIVKSSKSCVKLITNIEEKWSWMKVKN